MKEILRDLREERGTCGQFLNIINGGANKKNIQALSDFIANAVWRLLNVDDGGDHSTIRIVPPEIRMR